jgi:hypothetical protein
MSECRSAVESTPRKIADVAELTPPGRRVLTDPHSGRMALSKRDRAATADELEDSAP